MDHDLRHDPDESPGGTPTAAPHARLDPTDLRTVPMPELRTAEARLLDAAARGIEGEDGEPRDVRTFPEMILFEFARVVDLIQTWRLELDEFKECSTEHQNATESRLARLEDNVRAMALERDGKGKGKA